MPLFRNILAKNTNPCNNCINKNRCIHARNIYQNQVQNFPQNFNLTPNQQTSGINSRPLNKEDIEKLQENIKNKNNPQTFTVNIPLEEFLQNEQNSVIFYKNIANTLKEPTHINKLENISKECLKQVETLQKLYVDKHKKEFEFKNIPLTQTSSVKESLFLAINEELESYEKICEVLDKDINIHTKNQFNKILLHKLKRITTLQFLLFQNLS